MDISSSSTPNSSPPTKSNKISTTHTPTTNYSNSNSNSISNRSSMKKNVIWDEENLYLNDIIKSEISKGQIIEPKTPYHYYNEEENNNNNEDSNDSEYNNNRNDNRNNSSNINRNSRNLSSELEVDNSNISEIVDIIDVSKLDNIIATALFRRNIEYTTYLENSENEKEILNNNTNIIDKKSKSDFLEKRKRHYNEFVKVNTLPIDDDE